MLDFILYQGSTTEVDEEYKQYGAGAGVVMKLCERISTPNHLLIFDNYFSTYSLFQWLLTVKRIYGIGTVRMNRFGKPPLLEEKKFKKLPRGSSEEVLSKDGIILTQWLDNKRVVICSTYIGKGILDKCKRWDKKSKTQIEVERPEAIVLYNKHMGGVDKMDFLVTLYRTFTRSRKWTLRMITHALDLAITNNWLEYRLEADALGISKKKQLDLIHFRYEIGEALIYANKGSALKPRLGRPLKRNWDEANLDMEELATPLFPITGIPPRKKEIPPVVAVRVDELNHMPDFDTISTNAQRCKNSNCKRKTFMYCVKCKVHLCINRESNCFLQFHSK